MNAGTLCQRLLVTVRATDEILQAAQLMRHKHVGYLVVTDSVGASARPVGVLTDRDIVITVVARELDPRSVRVADIMTTSPVTLSEDASLQDALQLMRERRVRRILVLDGEGALAGVLSLDDVLQVFASDAQNVAAALREERQVEGRLRP
jgi:CBS domain-containing protein